MYHVQYIYIRCVLHMRVYMCVVHGRCVLSVCVCVYFKHGIHVWYYFILKINFYKFIESFHSFMESMNVHSCLTCIRIHLRSHVHY